MSVVTGLNETQIDGLLKNRESFEVVGLRGNFMAGVKLVETKIEALGMKCRVKSDLKSTVVQGGILGGVLGVVSAPVTLTAAAVGIAAGVGHTLATYDPDYEIIKDYVNKQLKVVYKK
ncbi:MAG: hypothetical protein KKG30_09275 [Gammaproteobacteria bacterium]|nr:hypothetical protein [Gammaproteobacteria bacterium]MBU1491272.1 hypothetical protein [Gammaproteobacteria bacterium]MBU2216723.1 hypothetical protein [Gammaproteobacteria bacterium]